MDDLYHEELLEAARAPHNREEMVGADLISSSASNSCGDGCQIFLKLTTDKSAIEYCTWIGTGCAISTASLSLLSDQVQGKDIDTIQSWDESTLLSWLGLTTFSTARKKCLLLGLRTMQKLLEKI